MKKFDAASSFLTPTVDRTVFTRAHCSDKRAKKSIFTIVKCVHPHTVLVELIEIVLRVRSTRYVPTTAIKNVVR